MPLSSVFSFISVVPTYKGMGQFVKDSYTLTQATQKSAEAFKALAGAYTSVLVAKYAARALTAFLRPAMDTQKSLQQIAAVTGISGAGLKKFRDEAFRVAAITPQGPQELLEALKDLRRASGSTAAALRGLEPAARLAIISGDLTVGRTGKMLGEMTRAFNFTGEQTEEAAYRLGAAALSVGLDIGFFEKIMGRLGKASSLAGQGFNDIVIAASLAGRAGEPALRTSTQLLRMSTDMIKGKAQAGMRELGIQVVDSSGYLRSFSDIFLDMASSFQKNAPLFREVVVRSFGAAALKPILGIVTQLDKGITTASGGVVRMGDAMRYLNDRMLQGKDIMGKAADEQLKRLDVRMALIGQGFYRVAQNIGVKLLPALTLMAGAIERIVASLNWVLENVPGAATGMAVLAAAGGLKLAGWAFKGALLGLSKIVGAVNVGIAGASGAAAGAAGTAGAAGAAGVLGAAGAAKAVQAAGAAALPAAAGSSVILPMAGGLGGRLKQQLSEMGPPSAGQLQQPAKLGWYARGLQRGQLYKAHMAMEGAGAFRKSLGPVAAGPRIWAMLDKLQPAIAPVVTLFGKIFGYAVGIGTKLAAIVTWGLLAKAAVVGIVLKVADWINYLVTGHGLLENIAVVWDAIKDAAGGVVAWIKEAKRELTGGLAASDATLADLSGLMDFMPTSIQRAYSKIVRAKAIERVRDQKLAESKLEMEKRAAAAIEFSSQRFADAVNELQEMSKYKPAVVKWQALEAVRAKFEAAAAGKISGLSKEQIAAAGKMPAMFGVIERWADLAIKQEAKPEDLELAMKAAKEMRVLGLDFDTMTGGGFLGAALDKKFVKGVLEPLAAGGAGKKGEGTLYGGTLVGALGQKGPASGIMWVADMVKTLMAGPAEDPKVAQERRDKVQQDIAQRNNEQLQALRDIVGLLRSRGVSGMGSMGSDPVHSGVPESLRP